MKLRSSSRLAHANFRTGFAGQCGIEEIDYVLARYADSGSHTPDHAIHAFVGRGRLRASPSVTMLVARRRCHHIDRDGGYVHHDNHCVRINSWLVATLQVGLLNAPGRVGACDSNNDVVQSEWAQLKCFSVRSGCVCLSSLVGQQGTAQATSQVVVRHAFRDDCCAGPFGPTYQARGRAGTVAILRRCRHEHSDNRSAS